MTPRIIPIPEPEVIDAFVRRNCDPKKAAASALPMRGIVIFSRHGQAEEVDFMAEAIATLPHMLKDLIHTAFCDSRVGHLYEVLMRFCTVGEAQLVGGHIAAKCRKRYGGHNGIRIMIKDVGALDFDPEHPAAEGDAA